MTDLSPPPELVQEWYLDATGPLYEREIATRAAQWGADQELEACCEYVYERFKLTTVAHIAQDLRTSRRPQPPSLKERALQAWAAVEAGTDDQTAMAIIRRALEALPE